MSNVMSSVMNGAMSNVKATTANHQGIDQPTGPAAPEAPNPRSMALLAGWSYVALFVLAVFANFFVRERLVDTTDAAAT
ncbi:MAG: DUF4386 domain-containing protein, partial [Acidimicrobiia bacterium]|nr:DUF4386 domain-containing protein [Acidimicrobiia bacterium]